MFLSEVNMFITCYTSFKSSVVLKEEDTSSSKNPAKCTNTSVRTVLNMFLKCLTTWIRMVGRARYNPCICIYFASWVLVGSAQAGICQHEMFSLLVLRCQLWVTLAAWWTRISSAFEWLLSLRCDAQRSKRELSVVTLREQAFLAPSKSVLTGRTWWK